MSFVRPAKSINRTHPLAYLVLAGLLLFQLAYATHHTDHSVGDLSETCELCVQLDQSEGALSPSSAAALSGNASTDVITSPGCTTPARRPSSYQSRAPPLS